MEVSVKENSWIAKLAAVKMNSEKLAIVFGSTIHLHNTRRNEFLQDKEWVCHELKHVEQYRQIGFARFLVSYLIEWVKSGYYNNKYEVEARESEKDEKLMKGIKFI